MSIIVQKYGGTSVGSIERIQNVAKRIIKTAQQGNKVVVTLSAMSGETNRLIALAKGFTNRPHKREMDMLVSSGEQVSIALLAIALESMGMKAISMTGSQVGIMTDSVFMNARITKIDAKNINAKLEEGSIVIVAGFQGVDVNGNITTLGRGGSDTTAVALAAALNADECEIYTDVDGVYTADPNKIKKAKKIEQICYDDMLELASLGAKVLHSRAVELAKKNNVKLHIRSSLNDNMGTWVIKETKEMEEMLISGLTSKINEVKYTIFDIPDKPGVAAKVFTALAEKNINVDMIVQTSGRKDSTNTISFTAAAGDLDLLQEIFSDFVKEGFVNETSVDKNIAIVSLVGVGMKSNVGIAAKMFDILSKANINIQMISTSEIKISIVIEKKAEVKAMKIIHKEFMLDK